MSPLHGLRLNCLLAPLVAALIGAAAVIAGAALHRADRAEAARYSDLTAIRGLAELSSLPGSVRLATWQLAHPDWRGLARVQVHDETLEILDQTGVVELRGGPAPELLLAYQGAQCWTDRGRCAVAAPSLPRQGQASVVVGWRDPLPPPAWWPWLALAGSVLLLGGGLGAYLVARVYRPVEWMDRAAAAAAAGESEPLGAAASAETASLRSSLAALISQRHHGDASDDKPA